MVAPAAGRLTAGSVTGIVTLTDGDNGSAVGVAGFATVGIEIVPLPEESKRTETPSIKRPFCVAVTFTSPVADPTENEEMTAESFG